MIINMCTKIITKVKDDDNNIYLHPVQGDNINIYINNNLCKCRLGLGVTILLLIYQTFDQGVMYLMLSFVDFNKFMCLSS